MTSFNLVFTALTLLLAEQILIEIVEAIKVPSIEKVLISSSSIYNIFRSVGEAWCVKSLGNLKIQILVSRAFANIDIRKSYNIAS